MIFFDCETYRFSAGYQAPKLVCLAIKIDNYISVQKGISDCSRVVRIALESGEHICNHYIAFDMAVMAANDPSLIPLIFEAYYNDLITCSDVRQKLIDIAENKFKIKSDEDIEEEEFEERTKGRSFGYSLATLAKDFLGEDLDKDTWRTSYADLDHVPLHLWPLGAIDYVKKDVDIAAKLWALQEKKQRYLADQYRQARASFWLRLMSNWGLRTDKQGIEELANRTKIEYRKVSARLEEAGLIRPDRVDRKGNEQLGARNTKEARRRIEKAYSDLGRPYPLTEKGLPSLSRTSCNESGDPLLFDYAKVASLRALMAKDLPMLSAGINAPIHSQFEVLKATGRTGSRKPNVQNLAREGGIRECIVPFCFVCGRTFNDWHRSTGACSCGNEITQFWMIDYGSVELCTLAQICLSLFGYSVLGDTINQDLDPHLRMASEILGESYENLSKIRDQGKGQDCISKQGFCECRYCTVNHARQTAKVSLFGYPGGLGAEAFVFYAQNSYGVKITKERAWELKKLWLRTYPEMGDYLRYMSTTAENVGMIEQFKSERYRGGARYTEACNTMFQGLAADLAKEAGFNIVREMYDSSLQSPLFGSRLVLFVHDEFVGQSLKSDIKIVAERAKQIMLKAAENWLPDIKVKAKVSIGDRYQ